MRYTLPIAALLAAMTLPGQQFVDTRPLLVRWLLPPVDLDGDRFPDLFDCNGSFHRNLAGLGFLRSSTQFGASPPAACAVDLDGDGDTEVVGMSSPVSPFPAIAWVLSRQNGVFILTHAGMLSLAATPELIRGLDIDGDGDQDLALGMGRSVRVLENRGGQFLDAPAFSATPQYGPDIGNLLVTDFDADSRPDLLLVCSAWPFSWLVALRNDGTRFVEETNLRLPPSPTGVGWAMVADVDGDGDDDVFEQGPQLRLLQNQNGSFVDVTATHLPGTNPSVGGYAFDVDADGDQDACFVATAPALSTIFRNDGTGRFLTVTTFAGLQQALPGGVGLAPVDMDGDGDLDLAGYGEGYALLRNDGSGDFEQDVSHPFQPLAGHFPITALDLDGDAVPEILCANSYLRRTRSGQLQSVPWPSGFGLQTVEQIGDLDGDGDLDLGSWYVYENDGAGGFSAGHPVPGASAPTILADLDGDGTLDVVASTNPQRVQAWRYAGGTFTALGNPVAGVSGDHLSAADVDRDGDVDVLVSRTMGSTAYLLENAGNGDLTAVPLSIGPGRVRAFDLDGTGPLELLVDRNSPTTQVPRVFRRQAGGYADATLAFLPTNFHGVVTAVGDLDGDGDLDLVGHSVLHNDGTGRMTAEPGNLIYPTYALADVDGDLDADLLAADTVFWNRDRHLEIPLPPRIGHSVLIRVASQPGYSSPGAWAALALSTDELVRPLAGPLGLLWLQAPMVIAAFPVPDPLGEATATLPVPALAGLKGTRVHLQAVLVRETGVALSPAVSTRIE